MKNIKNRLRAMIALLRSRAYLERRDEATELLPIPRNDSHGKCEPVEKDETEQNDISQSETMQPKQSPGELPARLE
jgi:hypothetical protein